MQLQVINSPFNQEQTELLNKVLPSLTEEQKTWLSGYLAASQSASAGTAAVEAPQTSQAPAPAAEPVSKEVTILFGSQTGNGQSLAEEMSKKLENQQFDVTLSSMNDFKANTLKKVKNLLVIVSTHGEGDPPDNAVSFYEFLNGRKAPQLQDMQYSVLSLGDSSYEFFCQTGKEFDTKLAELGGKQLIERVDCDVDFDEQAAEWMEGVIGALNENQAAASETSAVQTQESSSATEQTAYSRTNPFKAELLESVNLNGRGSNKETRHLELSLEGSNLEYEPGDSLGIFPENDPVLADQVIEEMGWDPDETIQLNKQGKVSSLRDALITYYEITVLTKPMVEKLSGLSSNPELLKLTQEGNESSLKEYIYGRDLLDLLRDFAPWESSASEFTANLRKIPPRLYSIASGPSANPDEVHLTIGKVCYDSHGRERTGVCSGQTAERSELGDEFSVYVQHNPNFKLPENNETPIIMVGPGTGAAPFRSFMEEREEQGVEGNSWMFFGEQYFVSDFLYQTDWQKWLKNGTLDRMDVAFSRDTEEKVYVQHRMLEKSKEFYEWIEQGAVLYICGDEKNMAHDVHQTLLQILKEEGGMSEMQADEYVAEMQQQKRYQRDVY